MPGRLIERTVVLAAVEATQNVDAVPTGAANTILIKDVNFDLDAKFVDRDNVRAYFGKDGGVMTTASIKLEGTVELAGSGTAGTAPALGALLKGCSMAESVLASPARVEYTPVSVGQQSLSIYYYDDGLLHKILGAQGSFQLMAKVEQFPSLKVNFVGVVGGDSAASTTSNTTAWKPPVAINKSNVVDVTLGCTYAAGALTGGTINASTGVEITFGNEVNFTPNCSTESVDVTDRNMTGSVTFEQTVAQELAFIAQFKANTQQSLGFTIGTAAGNKVILYAPAVQFKKHKKAVINKKRYVTYDLMILPVVGNDEFRIVFL